MMGSCTSVSPEPEKVDNTIVSARANPAQAMENNEIQTTAKNIPGLSIAPTLPVMGESHRILQPSTAPLKGTETFRARTTASVQLSI
ncbi:hypothetical protein GCM10022265_25550 [Marinobacter xestospongiae]